MKEKDKYKTTKENASKVSEFINSSILKNHNEINLTGYFQGEYQIFITINESGIITLKINTIAVRTEY